MYRKIEFTRLLQQGFWLLAISVLLVGQLWIPSLDDATSSVPEINHPAANSLPFECLSLAPDSDDCHDLFLPSVPEVGLASHVGLPAQQSQIRLQSPATGVPYAHLSRPPPAPFFT